jgi:hypothetical protein
VTFPIPNVKIYDGEVLSSPGAVQDMGNILFLKENVRVVLVIWQTGQGFVSNISYFGAVV